VSIPAAEFAPESNTTGRPDVREFTNHAISAEDLRGQKNTFLGHAFNYQHNAGSLECTAVAKATEFFAFV
jgi:hypothetical protein